MPPDPLAARLAEIEARLEKATPGPWGGDGNLFWTEKNEEELRALGWNRGDAWVAGDDVIASEADTALIAHAPTDLVFLTTALRRAVAALTDMAEFEKGPVTGKFDEPVSTRYARQVLADLARVAEGRDGR